MTASSVVVSVPGVGALKTVRDQRSCLSPGRTVSVGVRPEYVQIVDAPGENIMRMTVRSIVEGVAAWRYSFHREIPPSEACNIEAMLPKAAADALHRLAAECYLRFPPEHLVVIPTNRFFLP